MAISWPKAVAATTQIVNLHRPANPCQSLFVDAAYANCNNHKSTSGYIFLVAGGTITWRSKKQTVIALSSTEAEYVALSEAGHKAYWLRNLSEKLGFP